MGYNSPPKDLDDLHGPGAEEAMAIAERDNEILEQALENLKAKGENIDEEQVAFEALRIEREAPFVVNSQVDALNDQLRQERERAERAERERDELREIVEELSDQEIHENDLDVSYIRASLIEKARRALGGNYG